MCPMGCPLEIERTGEEISVKGNTCKRGEIYGKAEFSHPVRPITTLVRLKSGAVASCKTEEPMPKERIFEIVAAIGKLVLEDSAKIGDKIEVGLNDCSFNIIITGTPYSC